MTQALTKPVQQRLNKLVDSFRPTCAHPMGESASCDGQSFLYDLNSDGAYHTALFSEPSPTTDKILLTHMTAQQLIEHHDHLLKYNKRLLGKGHTYCPGHEEAAEEMLDSRSTDSPACLSQYDVEECRHRLGDSGKHGPKEPCGILVPSDISTVPIQPGGKRRCSVGQVLTAEKTLYIHYRGKALSIVNGERSGNTTFYDINLAHAHDITDSEGRSTGLRYYTTHQETPDFASQQLRTVFGAYDHLVAQGEHTMDKLDRHLTDENINRCTTLSRNRVRKDLDWSRLRLGEDIGFHYQTEVPHISDDGTLQQVTRYILSDNGVPVLQYSTTNPEQPMFALKQLQSIFRTLRGLQDADLQLLQVQLVGNLESDSG